MITLVCGGRDFNDWVLFNTAMNLLPFKPTVIVHGEAKGADTMAKQWAMSRGIYAVGIPALWNYHGNKAGPKRNQAMLDIMKIEYCVAFTGATGTRDMIERCNENKIPVWSPYD